MWLEALTQVVPVLAVGSGSHLLATVLGRHVRPAGPCVQYASVFVAAESFLPTGPWLVWREHAVTPPPGSRLLARTSGGLPGYASGRHVGVQFHPEALPWMVDWWSDPASGRTPRPRLSHGELAAFAREREPRVQQLGRELFDGFLRQALTAPGPRSSA